MQFHGLMHLTDLINFNEVLYLAEHPPNFGAVLSHHRLMESGQPQPDEHRSMSSRGPDTTANQSNPELRHGFTPQRMHVLAE
jgi:hypothetical protein